MDDTPEKPGVIIIHQTVFESWARDIGTFGALIAVMWFNAAYCGGSGWIYAISGFCWFIWIVGRSSQLHRNSHKTPSEAREWLDAKFPEPEA